MSQIALGTEIKGIEYIDAMDVDHGLLIQGAYKTNIGGSAFGDTIYGAGANTLYGNAGNDLIDGKSGHCSISGGAGNDTIYCRHGDTVHGGIGADMFVLALTDGQKSVTTTIMNFVQGEDIINDNALISAGYMREAIFGSIIYSHSYNDSDGHYVSNHYYVDFVKGRAGGSVEVIQSKSLGITICKIQQIRMKF